MIAINVTVFCVLSLLVLFAISFTLYQYDSLQDRINDLKTFLYIILMFLIPSALTSIVYLIFKVIL